MRLIDADKVLQETWKAEIEDMWHMHKTVEVVSAIDIKEAPTIKAIPIKWIYQWSAKHIGKWLSVADMLEDWEKENGK